MNELDVIFVIVRLRAFFEKEWLFVLAAALTVIAYILFFSYGYISWDDPEMVFRNTDVQQFRFSNFFRSYYVGNYLPLTMLVHGLAWQVFGDNASLHHALSIALHLVNGWLVLQLGRKLFATALPAFAGCVLFLLHPAQLESVGWIAEFKTVLYSFFFLISLHYFLKQLKEPNQGHYVLSLLFFAFALLSKPSAVTLPLVLVVFCFLIGPRSFVKIGLTVLPFVLLAGLFSYINILAQTEAQFINQAHAFVYWQRFLFAGFALARYFSLFLAPLHLSVVYAYPLAGAVPFLIGGLTWAAFIAALFIGFRKNASSVLLGLLMVLLNLLPVLQFIPFGEALYADRYMYLPLLGFGWLLGLGFEKLKLPVKFSLLPVSIVLCFLSFQRSRNWHSALELYENVLRNNPTSFVALNSAGVECMQQNDDKKAGAYFTEAISNNNRNYKGYYNRALLFLKEGKSAEAIVDFNACLALYDYAKAYAGRAAAYFQLRDLPKAKQDAEFALRLDTKQSKALFILAECYSETNQLQAAIDYYNRAIALQGNDADYFFKRAIAYGKMQNFTACISDLEVCLFLNSDYYEAYYWRGVAKINLRQNACADFETAARHQVQPAVTAYYKYCQ